MKPHDITGLLLAGGQGSRMGGVDKGLQLLHGQPLAQHALVRLAPQVGPLLISANRHLEQYQALAAPYAAPVLTDSLEGYAGPLAGFLTGLAHCHTPWLLTVPCDSPLFPLDLAQRLLAAAQSAQAPLAMACAPEHSPGQTTAPSPLRRQPVFCLLQRSLLPSLQRYTDAGGRQIGAWAAQAGCALAPFDQPGDAPHAFANANTLAELQALQQPSP